MSESASVTETTVTEDTCGGQSDVTDTSLPLVLVSAYQDEQQRHKAKALPHLPSHRFRFSVWHELSRTEVHGNELKAPRVRDGPPIKNEMFYKLRDENNRRIHHTKRGSERKSYQNDTENWEEAVRCNLSYQELGHQYQKENFIRVLKRLKKVEELNLMHDGLTDLASVTFPQCQILNLTQNYLKSFKKLPRIQYIQHLNMEDNDIEDLRGIEALKNAPLTSLCLRRNPVSFTLNYRQNVFVKLPRLQYLDGLPKTPEDSVFDDNPPQQESSSCVLS